MKANRIQADLRSQSSLIRLLCAASLSRTVLTRLLPMLRSDAWWMLLICLLPGLALLLLARLLMARTRAATLTEACRASLGPFGGWAVSLLLGLLLMLEGASGLTALVTLFTEGIGTRGTQFTLALLTAGVMVLCLHREGLPRAAVLLRWPMLAVLALPIAFALPDAHITYLRPTDEGNVLHVLRTSWSMAWPLLLLVTVEGTPRRSRTASAAFPCIIALTAVLLITLTIPSEVIPKDLPLAHSLLLSVQYLPTAVRTAGQVLLMLALFLGVAASALFAAVHLAAPLGGWPAWLPIALAAALTLTQLAAVPQLWQLLWRIMPWGVAALAALLILAHLTACFRRPRR